MFKYLSGHSFPYLNTCGGKDMDESNYVLKNKN
jgi:hypothetical protein